MKAEISRSELGARLSDLATGDAVAVVRDGPRTIVGLHPSEVLRLGGGAAFDALDQISEGWWAGFLSYDLGRAVEKIPSHNAALPIPDLLLARFEERIVIEDDAGSSTTSDTRSRDGWISSLDRNDHEDAVRTILEHLAAGDCYQVNLTRRLHLDRELDPVALFLRLRDGNPSPHQALLRIDDISVVSASPERFLRREGRKVETRPIKGTAADPRALERSAKDRAENVMIVDLARNDLGRVCEYGSVHVPALCELEEHPGLYHLVSTVAGTLRSDVRDGALIRATFPPASVTGCPKPRVLGIIEALEPVRRGVYCGAVGFIDADNDVLDLNVAIRTFTITSGSTYFGVGGGIVADSDPAAEWHETNLKARTLLALAEGL